VHFYFRILSKGKCFEKFSLFVLNRFKKVKMIKRLTISMVLVLSYLTASAQIATPSLDRVMKVQSPAAAGWRDVGTVGIQAASLTGKVKYNDTEIGDADIGGSIPAVLAAFKAEEFGAELYLRTDTTKTSKTDFVSYAPMPISFVAGTQETEDKLPETRLNLAYVFGETLSVGLGYRLNETKYEVIQDGAYFDPATGTPLAPYAGESTGKMTETGLMLSASLQLSEIFYLAAAMESIDAKTSDDNFGDSVGNSWSNMVFGLGLLVGEPGDSRFRVEYAMIQSPESIKEAEGTQPGHEHNKADTSLISLEAQFGDFLLAYYSETEKMLKENADETSATTKMGLGWNPEEGLTVSAYMYNIKLTQESGSNEIVSEPKGWQVNVGWNF
jgi:hypothetical protein